MKLSSICFTNLLNDPQYVEAARALADAVLQGTATDQARLQTMFRRTLSRQASDQELAELEDLVIQQRTYFADDVESARSFLQIGDHQPTSGATEVELAAWSIVAHTLLNLDETITLR